MTPRLTHDEILARFKIVAEDARAFFDIDPMWHFDYRMDLPTAGAEIHAQPAYLYARIRLQGEYLMNNPEEIAEYAAHEIAHLVSWEMMRVRDVLPAEWQDEKTPAGRMYNDAVEALTTRLERLYLRERGAFIKARLT